jgi:general secretion pathway protein F
MTAFRYEAVDASGRRKKGTITADTPRRARREIQNAGLTPLSIRSIRERTIGRTTAGGAKPKTKDVIAATRQLATLIDASTTVEEALAAVSSQMKGTAMADVLLAIRARIIEGWRLSDAMAEYPRTFSSLYRGIVAAGEASGNLGPVMIRLADMVESNRAMTMKALTSLIYPAAIFVVAVAVVVALMNFVVPEIVGQFARTGERLPLLTEIVIALSDFVRAWGWLVLLALIGMVIGVWQLRRREGPRRRMDRALLRLPLLGGLARDLDAARFARTLATLFASGAPLLDSLRAARRTVTNAHIHDRLDVTLTNVREGASLSQGLRRAEVFPPMMASMVAAGERSGALPQLLEKTASQMEQGFDATVTVALRLLEPIVIVTLGVVVLLIVLAIMLPILQINTMAL